MVHINFQKNLKISSKSKIKFVKDRPGHDFRYALNINKMVKKLKWKPKIHFEEGLRQTILWYLNNKKLLKKISKKNYENRMGLEI